MARKAAKSSPPQSQEFIDDSDAMLEAESGDEAKPASKKTSKDAKGKGKAEKKRVKKEESDGDEGKEEEEKEEVKPATKRRKVEVEEEEVESSTAQMQQGDDGSFADLGGKKRVSVRTFKGTTYVDIREFYEDKSGEMKPGKKGISMNVELWETLKGLIPAVDAEVQKVGKGSKKK